MELNRVGLNLIDRQKLDKFLELTVEMNLSSFVNLYNKLHSEAIQEDWDRDLRRISTWHETLTDYLNSWELAKWYDANWEGGNNFGVLSNHLPVLEKGDHNV